MPHQSKALLVICHKLFTVRPHCPWLYISFIVSVFIHKHLLVVANLVFLSQQNREQTTTLQI